MTSEVLTQALLANQVATFGAGRIFNLLSAPGGPVSIVAERRSVQGGQTQPRKFTNIPPGSKYIAEKGEEWTYLRVTSTVNQQITIFIGDDDMQFNAAVTVTGTAQVAVNPSASINSPVTSNLAANTTDPTGVPQNLARRRVTVFCTSTSAAAVRVSAAGLASTGLEISPGTYAEFDTTAALGIRNDTSAAGLATWGYFEES